VVASTAIVVNVPQVGTKSGVPSPLPSPPGGKNEKFNCSQNPGRLISIGNAMRR
jgi:hypothetical protein